MSWHTLALFAHIVGVLTLFISMALQWLCTLRVRRARTIAQVRDWSGLARSVYRLTPVSGVLILGAGIYMTTIAWSLLTEIARRKRRCFGPNREAGFHWLQPLLLRVHCGTLVLTAGSLLGALR